MRTIALAILIGLLLWSRVCLAENYVLEGQMGSQINYELQQQVARGPGTQKLVLTFVVPETFTSPTYHQEIARFQLNFSPEPEQRGETRDKRGNQIIAATWNRPPESIAVYLSCTARNQTKLQPFRTSTPFPLGSVTAEVEPYLAATQQIQVNDSRIRQQAVQLTQGVTTEFDAVQHILTWVVDNLRYVNPPPQYDGLYSLQHGKGNCQNFSHLSAALMRAVGIPVRIVNGVTLNKPYDISRQGGVLTFKMGQGRHSWIEVWFPDLGWVPFDPQQSELFVSNRYLRVEVGVDNAETINDGLLRWSQNADTQGKPHVQESFNADFVSDKVQISGSRQAYGPKNLLLSPLVLAAFTQITVPSIPPPPVISYEQRARLRFTVPFLFGNLDYPEDVDFAFPRAPASATGANRFQMIRNFLVETAEYVTTKLTQYAQVFVLQKPIKLESIGLALHKFGGDGTLWVELLRDNNGKPGAPLSTSDLQMLDQLSSRPGYRWVDFDFRKDSPILMPGSYWIALGFTGNPVVNWFYTYGKSVGPVEGTRYKAVFQDDWSGALNYEFNYRVVGLTAP
jgi:hypothetical protein